MLINSRIFKDLYKTKKFTQESLAESLNVNRGIIANWVRIGDIPNKYLPDLHRVFGSDVSKFIVDSSEIIQSDIDHGKIESTDYVPYFDIDVTAGMVDVFTDTSITQPTSLVHIPGLVADFVVPVHGHSMHPEISNGDWIAVKRIEDMSFFNYGQKHLVITKEQRLVKIIRKNANEKLITLTSCNSSYDDIDLPKKAITHLFLIVQVLKREVT